MSGGRAAGKVGVGVAVAGGWVIVGVAETMAVAVGSMVRTGVGVDTVVAGVSAATTVTVGPAVCIGAGVDTVVAGVSAAATVAVGPTVRTGVGVAVGRVSVRTAKTTTTTSPSPPTRRTPIHPLDTPCRGPGRRPVRRTWLGQRRDDERRSLLGRLFGTLEPDRVRRSRLIVAS